MVPDADGKWKYTFTAPKYDENDKEIVYSVKESAVAGFHASYEGYNILNTYIKPVTVALPKVYKEVRGEQPPAETFVFLLEGQDGAPMPDVSKDGQLKVEVNGSGEVSLGEITFSKAGKYVYTVTEIGGGKDGWSYDDEVYTLIVTVSQQGEELSVSTELKDREGERDKILFVNSYSEPGEEPDNPDNPGNENTGGGNPNTDDGSSPNLPIEQPPSIVSKTGDIADARLWIILAAIAGGAVILLLTKRKE